VRNSAGYSLQILRQLFEGQKKNEITAYVKINFFLRKNMFSIFAEIPAGVYAERSRSAGIY
jgi:hypothetical protein